MFNMNNKQYPTLIVIEGLDNVGKSTIIGKLQDELSSHLNSAECKYFSLPNRHNVLTTKAFNNNDNMIGFYSMMASNMETIRDLILPELEKGNWVIVDRWFASTMTYQTLIPYLKQGLPENEAYVKAHNLMQSMMYMMSYGIQPGFIINIQSSKELRSKFTHMKESEDSTLIIEEDRMSLKHHDLFASMMNNAVCRLGRLSDSLSVNGDGTDYHYFNDGKPETLDSIVESIIEEIHGVLIDNY